MADNLGCVDVDTAILQVDDVPDVDLGANDTICVGSARIFCAPPGNPGTTYDWTLNNNPFATTQCIFASSPGQYKVILTTAALCQDEDSVSLDVSLALELFLANDEQSQFQKIHSTKLHP